MKTGWNVLQRYSKRAQYSEADVKADKPADQRSKQVGERIKQLIPLQHRVQLHHHRRERGEAATEANRKQESVLVRNEACFIEPGRMRNQVREHAHNKAAEQICTQCSP